MTRMTWRVVSLLSVFMFFTGLAFAKSNSSVVVASSLNPSTFGASVKFTATVTPSTATGTVTFKDGTTTLGTGTIATGKATFTITTLAVGSHSITAVYGGDTNLNGSTSSVLTQTVNKANSSVALASSLNPSTFGASVKFTATITPSTATGTVTFKDGTTTLGTGTIATGTATFTITTLAVGSHSITAAYGGDTNDNSSTSSTLTQTVNKVNSTVALASSLNPSTFGASVKFTATVTPSTASGTVTFKDGTTTLGTGTIATGKATFTTTTLVVGSHSITAAYGGDTNDNSSTSSTLTQTVNKVNSTVALSSSANPSGLGASVTFTATVTPSTATGTVTFKDGTTTLGTGTIAAGKAMFSISTLALGSHSITAAYAGDTNINSSTSSTLTQTVKQASSVALASSENPSIPNASVTFTATVTPSTATGTVTFKDGTTTLGTGSLSGGQASFSMSTLALGSHSITAVYGGNSTFAGSTSAVLTQNVFTITSIVVTPQNVSLPLNSMQQYTATATLSNGSNQNVSANVAWTASDTSLATFSATGLLTALGQGQITIQATSGSISAATNLTIGRSSFVQVGDLSTARFGHTATLLPSGKVLIVGGQDLNNNLLATAELYDPATGTFSPVTSGLSTARSNHTATLLNDGTVLIVGGMGGFPRTSLASVEHYDPVTGSFSFWTNMNQPHSQHAATLLTNGMVLISGGSSGSGASAAEVYDPSSGFFTLTGDLATHRVSHTATLLNNGTVLVAGGYSLVSNSNTASAEVYDPTTGTFSAAGSLSVARIFHTATLLSSGKVLIAGGAPSPSVSAEIYDPATNAFTLTGSLSLSHSAHSATALSNGSVLVAAGAASASGLAGTAELFDSSSQTFIGAGSLATPRNFHAATLLNDGTVLIVGGSDAQGRALASAELYAPTTLPSPGSLQITPAEVNMLVADTKQFTAVDDFGRPRSDVVWTLSDTTLATLSADSSPKLTATAVGQLTLTATIGTTSAQTPVVIWPLGTVFPSGTALWSNATLPGFSPVQVVQARPTGYGPDLYTIAQSSDGTQSILQAFSADGQQLWQRQLPVVNSQSVPDAFGGIVVTENNTCFAGQTVPMTIEDIDPATGQSLWQIAAAAVQVGPNLVYCYPSTAAPQIAVRDDGKVAISEPTNNGLPPLVVVDRGFVVQISIPPSSFMPITGPVQSEQSLTGPPLINADGSIYVEYQVRQSSASPPYVISAVLYLLKVVPDTNTTSAVQLMSNADLNAPPRFPQPRDSSLLPGTIMPDGQGGVIATWTISPSSPQNPPPLGVHYYQGAHVVAGVVTGPYDFLFTPKSVGPGKYLALVLGENNTAFVSDTSDADFGAQIVSFDLTSGAVNWSYRTAPQNTLELIRSTAGNGLIAKVTDQTGSESAARFDSAGAATFDTLPSLSSIEYFVAGRTWLGRQPGGNLVSLVASPPAQVLPRDPRDISLTGFSQTGPNQAVITASLTRIATALPLYSACNTWLQGTGGSGLVQIQGLVSNNLYGHATILQFGSNNYSTWAFSGTSNADHTLIPNLPAGVAMTVNDLSGIYNPLWPDQHDGQTHPFVIGPNSYPGNQQRAKDAVFIHEVAHQIQVPGFGSDFGQPDIGKANDGLVNDNCKGLIEGPQIKNLSPNTGPVGSVVTITGVNFGDSSGTNSTVTFSPGVAATPSSWNNGQIVVTVPAGATTGNLVVTVASLSSSKNFTVH